MVLCENSSKMIFFRVEKKKMKIFSFFTNSNTNHTHFSLNSAGFPLKWLFSGRRTGGRFSHSWSIPAPFLLNSGSPLDCAWPGVSEIDHLLRAEERNDLCTGYRFYYFCTQFLFLRVNSARECEFLLADNFDIVLLRKHPFNEKQLSESSDERYLLLLLVVISKSISRKIEVIPYLSSSLSLCSWSFINLVLKEYWAQCELRSAAYD